ncbi:hypothetical protein B296_00053824 [Ensete ventricosum]|uniref:Uncharacterized protein n=1 Tax=Ensete ventricosum TaxID=4639 RepID=A0A426XHP6_ENSVE|nr:hypothetical protein B296_00053824 [Ensete ventricosum]
MKAGGVGVGYIYAREARGEEDRGGDKGSAALGLEGSAGFGRRRESGRWEGRKANAAH